MNKSRSMKFFCITPLPLFYVITKSISTISFLGAWVFIVVFLILLALKLYNKKRPLKNFILKSAYRLVGLLLFFMVWFVIWLTLWDEHYLLMYSITLLYFLLWYLVLVKLQVFKKKKTILIILPILLVAFTSIRVKEYWAAALSDLRRNDSSTNYLMTNGVTADRLLQGWGCGDGSFF